MSANAVGMRDEVPQVADKSPPTELAARSALVGGALAATGGGQPILESLAFRRYEACALTG